MDSDKAPKEGLLKRMGSGIRFAVLPVSAWRDTSSAVSNLKATAKAASSTLQSASAAEAKRETWLEAVLRHHVTREQLVHQVAVRQCVAYLCIAFIAFALYGAIAWGSYVPSAGCFALATIYYLQAALRLHQIRHRDLCSFSEFISRVATSPRELLPLGIPDGWKIR